MRRLVAATLCLSCGGAPLPRDTTASNTRADDPWLEGERCVADLHVDAGHDDTGLRVERVLAGTGKVVGDGETVRVHYVAQLANGTAIHDTREGGAPSEIIIGSTHVICGFERALLGMRAGEQRRVVVPSRLAFGEAGKPPDVPPRADLVFVIDLFLPAETVSSPRSTPVRPATSRGGGGRGGH